MSLATVIHGSCAQRSRFQQLRRRCSPDPWDSRVPAGNPLFFLLAQSLAGTFGHFPVSSSGFLFFSSCSGGAGCETRTSFTRPGYSWAVLAGSGVDYTLLDGALGPAQRQIFPLIRWSGRKPLRAFSPHPQWAQSCKHRSGSTCAAFRVPGPDRLCRAAPPRL